MTIVAKKRSNTTIVDLDGPQGNAFVLLGMAKSTMEKSGLEKQQQDPAHDQSPFKEEVVEEKPEVQSVLVDKTNTPVVQPLLNKGRSLLKSLASGKPAKKSWIDNSHE